MNGLSTDISMRLLTKITRLSSLYPVNPFISNFSAGTMDDADGDNNGEAPAPGTIGSMVGIIGIL